MIGLARFVDRARIAYRRRHGLASNPAAPVTISFVGPAAEIEPEIAAVMSEPWPTGWPAVTVRLVMP